MFPIMLYSGSERSITKMQESINETLHCNDDKMSPKGICYQRAGCMAQAFCVKAPVTRIALLVMLFVTNLMRRNRSLFL